MTQQTAHPASPIGIAPQANELPRRLGALSLFLLIVAFNAPIAAMAGFMQLSVGLGGTIAAPVYFLAAGAILLLFSVGFIEMARHMEKPGAFYTFVLAGLGKSAGLAGALIALAAYSLLAVGAYPYMGIVASEFAEHMTGGTLLPIPVWGIVFLGIVTTIGLFRVDLSMRLLGTLVVLEIIVVAGWQLAIMVQGGAEGYSPASFSPTLALEAAPALGILFAMLTMIGIEAGACYSQETKRPEKTVGRAMFLAITFLTLFYAAGTWFYIISVGPSEAVSHALNNPVGSFFDSVKAYLGAIFVPIISLVLVTSQMAALNSAQGAAARYFFALSREGLLPQWLGRVHPRLESPYAASLFVAMMAFCLLVSIMIFGFDPVATYAAMAGMGIYFLLPLMIGTSIAIVVFFATRPDLRGQVWKRRIAPVLATVALLILFVFTSLNLETLVGSKTIVVVSVASAVLIPAFGLILAAWLRRNRPALYAAIGSVER